MDSNSHVPLGLFDVSAKGPGYPVPGRSYNSNFHQHQQQQAAHSNYGFQLLIGRGFFIPNSHVQQNQNYQNRSNNNHYNGYNGSNNFHKNFRQNTFNEDYLKNKNVSSVSKIQTEASSVVDSNSDIAFTEPGRLESKISTLQTSEEEVGRRYPTPVT